MPAVRPDSHTLPRPPIHETSNIMWRFVVGR